MNNKAGVRRKQDPVASIVVTGCTHGKSCGSLKTAAFFLSLSMLQVILFQTFALNKNSFFFL